MIQKFRWRFIALSVISLFLILLIPIGSLVAINFYQDNQQVNQVLSALTMNNGNLTPDNSRLLYRQKNNFIAGKANPESIFQYRYFNVTFDKDGNAVVTNRPKQFNISQKQINKKISTLKRKKGITRFDGNNYAFETYQDQFGRRNIVFLNTTLIFSHSWMLFRLSILLSVGALILFTIILIIFSGKAVKPIAEAYHKQQQFITNAGHELKTPLAIISANTEMEEMLGHESEWTKSTKEQTARLTELINHLIALARMSETGEIALGSVNLSKITAKNCHDFSSFMKKKELNFKSDIQPDIAVVAEEKSLTELINIFLDNAQKYCDPKGTVNVKLSKNKWNTYANLVIGNTYAEGKGENYQNFFDRFYREDQSHNNKKSGFGIGLSMAQDLVKAFKGKIKVHYHKDSIYFTISLKLTK